MTTVVGNELSTPIPQRRLEELVQREAPAVLAYLTRRVAAPADAAELLGDVLLVVWRRIDAMPEQPREARMWMFGITRKVLAGSHRSHRRRQALTARLRHEITTVNTSADLTGSNEHGPSDAQADWLTSAMDQLSTKDREIISIIHWDSLTLTEAARHLHLPASTTRSRYHRARNRLKQLLADNGQPAD